MDRLPPRTLLEQLVRQARRTIEETCREFERAAREHGERATLSPRHLARWMAGDIGSARPVAQRVAAIYWGYDFDQLIGPPFRGTSSSRPDTVEQAHDDQPATGVLQHVEQLRRSLHDAVSAESMSEAGLDEWELTVLTHGQATRVRPASQMLGELTADFIELQRLLDRRHAATALTRLTRVTAQMAGLMFLTLIKLNQPLAARNWARTARVAADEAGDNQTRSWVRAQEAYVHYYAGNLAEAVTVARQAQALAGRTKCVGVPLAAALEARALGAQGNRGDAVLALGRAEASLFALSPDDHVPSAFGYNEAQLRFHEGNTYTQLRDPEAAARAQQRALALAPLGDFLDRTLIQLDAAACLVYRNDADEALRVATSALLDLTHEQRQGLVLLRGAEVLDAMPQVQRALPTARDFSNLLRPSKGEC